MNFSYSKTEELFLQMIRSFAENEKAEDAPVAIIVRTIALIKSINEPKSENIGISQRKA